MQKEVTESLKNIVALMKCCGVTVEDAMAITLLLSEHDTEEQMLDWMMEQEKAPTPRALFEKAVQLAGLMDGDCDASGGQ